MGYTKQYTICRQWDAAVDFGSPVSAWTDTMLDVVQKYGRPTNAKDVQNLRAEVRRINEENARVAKRGTSC